MLADRQQDGFGGDYVLHFAIDPRSPSKLYAISFDPQSQKQAVLASDDARKTWAPLAKRPSEVMQMSWRDCVR